MLSPAKSIRTGRKLLFFRVAGQLAWMLFVKLLVQFVDLLGGFCQSPASGGGDLVDAPPSACDSAVRGLQQTAALQLMQERIEGSGANAVSVMRQFLHHGQTEDRLVSRMHQHVNADQAEVEIALTIGHNATIPLELESNCMLSVFDISYAS